MASLNHVRFRWAACQIAYICALHSDRQSRDALEFLPPTLRKLYERILSRVNDGPAEVQKMVQRALMWIAYAVRPHSLAELAEVLAVEEGHSLIDSEAIVDGSAIITSCSSLIRTSDARDAQDTSLIEFSHFTVKEFLLGLRESSEAEFRKYGLMPKKDAQLKLAKLCLTYLTMAECGSNVPKTEEECSNLKTRYPFWSHATKWIEYRGDEHDKSYLKLSRTLFDPSKSENFMCWAQTLGL